MRLNYFLIMGFLISALSGFAQEKSISGAVTDQNGQVLPGVSVVIVGTGKGTQTDFDGKYVIMANLGQTLRFSYIGMKSMEQIVGESAVVNVSLEEDAQALEEVVVVAYGQQNRNKLVQSVSTVGADEIRDIPALSPQELLQGQASGVQIVNSSGILGASPVVKIRGVASISSGGRPLVVIDGVPLNDSVETEGQGGQGLNPLGDINPNDIESFSVLKDAAATAVYGSRGANGVILITTKRGRKNQDTRVTLDVTTSWSKSTDIFDMMNADQFRQFLVDRGSANSVDQLPQGSFDWPTNVARTGFSQTQNLSISGGNAKTTYYIGLTHNDQEGFIIGNNLKRLSGRMNLAHEVNDWLRVGMNLGLTENRNDRVGSENSTFAPFTSAFLQQPWVEPKDEDGNFVNTGFIANVIAIETLDINDANTFRTTGNVYGELDLAQGLTFRSDFGIDRILLEQFQRSFEVNSPGGYAQNIISQQNKYVFTNTLNYQKTLGEAHDLNALVGMSFEQTDIRNIEVETTGFLTDQQINNISGSTPTTATNDVRGSRLVGYFARLNYSFDNKYILESSIRTDGSSRFGVNNRFGTFWAAGGAWVLTNEKFMENVAWLDLLKLRGNYGTSGNDRIGDFASLESFEGGNISNYNGGSGIRLTSAGNPDLKWERSFSYDIGFEAALFDNRVRLNLDYYRKRTKDLLLNVPIPQTNGGLNSILSNVGEMENRGWDIDFAVDWVRKPKFKWTTSLNLGINENEVISLPGANLDNQDRRFVAATTNQRAIEGHSVNTFYMIRYKGVNPETGNAEWLDVDGNVTTNPTPNDRVIVGDANPDFVGGFRNSITLGDFDLNFFFNFSYGNEILIDGLRFTDNPVNNFNKRTELLDVWRNPGDNSYVPSFASPTFTTFNQASTLQLRDGSFARLKNLTLGYSVPKRYLDKMGVFNGFRIYVTGNNLLTIKKSNLDGIDPEVSDSLNNGRQGETFFTPPQFKTYVVGLRLTF